MDFNLKQWKYQQQQQLESEQQEQQASDDSSTALPLFVPDQLTNKLSDMSALNPVDSTTTSTRFSKMGMGYFSMGQWQELELQALIFRHFLAGACVPPELVHLVKKSLLSPPPSSYYHHPLEQFYSHYHPTLIQSGYWGRGSMDPEPGRCRRTDGKKWRCSRDVVAGQKYCERHVHRGRNRSRKPVEVHTPSTSTTTTTTTTTGVGVGASGGGSSRRGSGVLKTNTPFTVQTLAGGAHFDLSGPSPSIDLHQINQRPSESRSDNRGPFQAQNKVQKSGNGGVLRHFFDDWPPRSLQEPGTALSISTPGNSTSDFSLKLSTGNGDGLSQGDGNNLDRDGVQLNWGGGWGTNQAAPMGGPLAEVLRSSSTYNSSPTSVLHRLQRGSTSETSYVST